ncbi:MAG: HemK2/MTQ2 family protein methyltransferase [Candidatus Bathyarchaeia archaeon]
MGHVYTPAEDSYLLAKHVKRLVRGDVLDMGSGSGLQTAIAAEKEEVKHVLAVDINPIALEEARRRVRASGLSEKVDFRLSDLFEEVDGTYDWILFNPPYLPSDGEVDELSWAGGRAGRELIHRFLSGAPEHLKKSGSMLLIYSNRTALDPSNYGGYEWTIIDEEDLFFEKLYCALVRLAHFQSDAKASEEAGREGKVGYNS